MKQKCGKWFMLAVFLWQITCLGAAAEESKAIKEDTRLENGIALRAILPENQYDEKKTYFDDGTWGKTENTN